MTRPPRRASGQTAGMPLPPPQGPGPVRHDRSLLTDDDLHLFNEGTHYRLFEKLGAHFLAEDPEPGTQFAVWAPGAEGVSVLGDFNGWDPGRHPLLPRGSSGIWEGFIPGLFPGELYKYRIFPRHGGPSLEKADPFAFRTEVPPRTASIVARLEYDWGDSEWMEGRAGRPAHRGPISIYEVHLGSWQRSPDQGQRPLTYREIALPLASHVGKLGFTHVELLPVMEHPFYGSWGYQTTGYFAPTSRYGTPQDFMFLVDTLHRHGIGVLLDWVPSHFPADGHGLAHFDGTHLYEHLDPRLGFHPDWKSSIFNYGRHEVPPFLVSSAAWWIDRYHADGLRVDAVASMLYLDYSREEGGWIPNRYGGRENIEAIHFLRRLNEFLYERFPGIQTFAEESTSWPMVSRPTWAGGLGFGFKWDMGWMHDTLRYISKDPVHRRYHHNDLTFRGLYAFHENFVLPLSHDEVVHGKGSLLGRMPGDDWQKFSNLRLLYAYMYAQPGKKLLFMGSEIGQWSEWQHEHSLDWHLLQWDRHQGVERLIGDLNRAYRAERALHELDCDPHGHEWIDANDADNSVLTFLRKDASGEGCVAVLFNFTPVPRWDYRVGLPRPGHWREILNTDAREYGGSGLGNAGGVRADGPPWHGRPHSASVLLPPLAAVYLRWERG